MHRFKVKNILNQLKSLNRFYSHNIKSENLLTESIIPSTKTGNLTLVSLSNDVYYNLALEQYIADSYDFENRNILFLWQNEPCVVIGRYQNAWSECNLIEMKRLGDIKLARRASGGGCVYHDLGNLNCTFFTTRDRYNRKFNLNIIKNGLEKLNFDEKIRFKISPRNDIFIEDDEKSEFKISGTSSRISKNYSYHHCTVLFDASIENMSVLHTNFDETEIISSRGTASVRSKCKNLKVFDRNSVNMKQIVDKIATEYWHKHSSNWSIEHLYQYIDPVELKIDSTSVYKEFTSWSYIYGNTPKFQLKIDLDSLMGSNAFILFFIENGTIVNIETTNFNYKYLDEFTTHAHLFYNCELKRASLVDVFDRNRELMNKKLFRVFYQFFEKNFV